MPAGAPPATGALPEKHVHQSFWLWVMCLTGVDYFSTLGYQPSIAFEFAGRLAPLATMFLVLATLGGALPVYSHVAGESFRGQGSIAMLEALVRGWTGKFFVLVLLGFAATDFVITKTLSAADAAEHIIHNPFWTGAPPFLQSGLVVTMLLLVLLGAMFLRGFREVIGVAVALVTVYMALNAIVIVGGLAYLGTHWELVSQWRDALARGDWALPEAPLSGTGPWTMLAVSLLVFPKLALGLSGFETGVAVMPLVRGNEGDDSNRPAGRIRNTRKLLLTAAAVMSAYLFGSAVVTTMLIPAAALRDGGPAFDRALAYLAHGEGGLKVLPICGTTFGTLYDLSTVTILWFAGASAMSGLLNLVPNYLPRYGMAPQWASAIRPLVVLFTIIGLLVTWLFDANVKAQSAAYATGVMALICSACVAVIIDRWNKKHGSWIVRVPWVYVGIGLVFLYTAGAIVVEKSEGLKIAGAFVVAVLIFSMVSRMIRSGELRFQSFEFGDAESRVLWDTVKYLDFQILVPHRPDRREIAEKEAHIRKTHRLPPEAPIVFLEAHLGDPSEFLHRPRLQVRQEEGRFIITVRRCVSIAHVIAAIALEISRQRDPPEIHFGWSDESPLRANVGFLLFGEGNVPWMVRELIQEHEPDPARRPRVIVG